MKKWYAPSSQKIFPKPHGQLLLLTPASGHGLGRTSGVYSCRSSPRNAASLPGVLHLQRAGAHTWARWRSPPGTRGAALRARARRAAGRGNRRGGEAAEEVSVSVSSALRKLREAATAEWWRVSPGQVPRRGCEDRAGELWRFRGLPALSAAAGGGGSVRVLR